MNNKFRYFVPINFEKSKKDDKDVYLVGGLITDTSKDSEGENVSSDGLDFSEFNFINWNHSKNPEDIIGAPVSWKHIPGQGVFMQGELYPDIPRAKAAIDLMKALQKSKKGAKLGWSIEGQVLERDLIDPAKVKKAKVNAVALCPFPKNGNTYADLLTKGFTGEDCFQKDEDLEFDEDFKGLDLDDKEIDKDGNIVTKAQSTQNSAPLIKESVEGNEKKSIREDKKVIEVVSHQSDKLKKAFVVLVEAHKNSQISTEKLLNVLGINK